MSYIRPCFGCIELSEVCISPALVECSSETILPLRKLMVAVVKELAFSMMTEMICSEDVNSAVKVEIKNER